MSLLAGAAIFNDGGRVDFRDFLDFDKAVPMVNYPPGKVAEIVSFGGLVMGQKGTQMTIIDLERVDGINPHFDDNTMVSVIYTPQFPYKFKSPLLKRLLLQEPPDDDPDIAKQLREKQEQLRKDIIPYTPNYAGFSFVNDLSTDGTEEYVKNFRFVTEEPEDGQIMTPDYDETTGFTTTSSYDASGLDEALYYEGGVVRVRANIYPGHHFKGYYRYLILVNNAPNEDLEVQWSGIKISRRGGLVRLVDDSANGFFMSDNIDQLQATLNEGVVETYQRISANYHVLTAVTLLEFEVYFTVPIKIETFAIAFCTEEEAQARAVPNERFIDIIGTKVIGVRHNSYLKYPGERKQKTKQNPEGKERTTGYLYDFSTTWNIQRVTPNMARYVSEAWQTVQVMPWQENLTYRGRDAPRRISHIVLKAQTQGGGDGSIYVSNFVLETGKPKTRPR